MDGGNITPTSRIWSSVAAGKACFNQIRARSSKFARKVRYVYRFGCVTSEYLPRVRASGSLSHDRDTFYGGDERGYVDYPRNVATVAA
jgi:hypothetical protein